MQVETLGKVFEALWITKDQVVGALRCIRTRFGFMHILRESCDLAVDVNLLHGSVRNSSSGFLRRTLRIDFPPGQNTVHKLEQYRSSTVSWSSAS